MYLPTCYKLLNEINNFRIIEVKHTVNGAIKYIIFSKEDIKSTKWCCVQDKMQGAYAVYPYNSRANMLDICLLRRQI